MSSAINFGEGSGELVEESVEDIDALMRAATKGGTSLIRLVLTQGRGPILVNVTAIRTVLPTGSGGF